MTLNLKPQNTRKPPGYRSYPFHQELLRDLQRVGDHWILPGKKRGHGVRYRNNALHKNQKSSGTSYVGN